ncbi:hypothetical protein GGI25_003028 [Coemansia spiralis]|uniref:Uncharacterized protein n=2 Tax=Coemansia TaxID=4863 RepID=A0A9W8G2V1_9FUNG|nr:hypothetical protein EDC05_002975 [Coemansia umbellata]KAJ2622034.1 hypothetical protein GGI26_003610 [Coemansia sp. RSA 1358]KAJ2677638.1 hypothetical protein GGI25_003028 [Coemansia spiralis]
MAVYGPKKLTNKKAEALKRKLQQQQKHSASKQTARTKKASIEPLAKRQQREKALRKAFGPEKDVLGISQSSTKHNAGRKDVCMSLDRTIAQNTKISEALRGVGKAPILTPSQLKERANEERERMAVAYEQHQATVNETVDELAQLMSNTT